MATSLPDLTSTFDEVALAERLARASRDRIAERVRLGTPFLISVRMEADYIAEAWARYDEKVQLPAIRIAFDEFYGRYPKKPSFDPPVQVPSPDRFG